MDGRYFKAILVVVQQSRVVTWNLAFSRHLFWTTIEPPVNFLGSNVLANVIGLICILQDVPVFESVQ